MDNLQTGAFIWELRKEQGMTQKELADRLHITDRAVSKWERGLCAPDLSTLEPLAELLGVTVTELLAGRRMAEEPHKEEIEANVRNALRYSGDELRQAARALRKKYRIVWGCVLIAAFISLAVLWWKGSFHIVERLESPDGTCLLTIYDRDVAIDRLSRKPAVTVVNRMPVGAYTTAVYGGAAFQGAWWSPDSTKYVLAFETNKGTQLVLNHMIGHSASNLNAYLSMGVDWGELSDRAPQYPEEGVFPDVAYQFLQWSLDSQSALIYYSFSDTDGTRHEGYFWYNCETGTVTGTLKLQAS